MVVESNGVPAQQLAPAGIKRDTRKEENARRAEQFIDLPLAERDLPFSLEPVQP